MKGGTHESHSYVLIGIGHLNVLLFFRIELRRYRRLAVGVSEAIGGKSQRHGMFVGSLVSTTLD